MPTKAKRIRDAIAPYAASPDTPVVASNTRTRLIDAALAEFNERGFSGTDSNRIARRAGFAPQTFYRSFKDKTEIFVSAYQSWEEIERASIGGLLARKATTKQIIDATVAHHRAYKIFRRSLRQLSLEDPIIRSARAASRKRQIAQIQSWRQASDLVSNEGDVAADLLQMERLADALAEEEFNDMDLNPSALESALSELIARIRKPPGS